MGTRGLPPDLVRPLLKVFSRWALSPSVSWQTTRRRIDLGLRFPGPPRDVRVARERVGGVPCEVHLPAGVGTAGPTLLYLHGGGWTFGSVRGYRSPCARLAKALRWRVVVPST